MDYDRPELMKLENVLILIKGIAKDGPVFETASGEYMLSANAYEADE